MRAWAAGLSTGKSSVVRVRSTNRMANCCKDFSYDSRRSWFVCGSSFVVQFIIFGVHSSVGIFFIAFGREFHRSESATGNSLFLTLIAMLFVLEKDFWLIVDGMVGLQISVG